MFGAIAGDIIGSRFEFHPIKNTEFKLFTPDCRFTDDTVLTLATASAFVHKQSFAQSYRDFYQRYPEAGYGQRFSNWAETVDSRPYYSYGNGSAMRVSPVAWIAADQNQLLDLATQTAMPTHDHPEGIKGAQAVALAIFMARDGAAKDEIKAAITEGFGYDLQRPLSQIRPAYTFEVSCQRSVPEALCCFFESTDFVSAIRLAVSLGGDADTQAAIAGSVAEAFYGGVPDEILERLREYLDPFLGDICRRFMQLRDGA